MMGDADNEVVVPVEDIEEWMDEALEVVDEGLGSLLEFMTHLSLSMHQVTLKMKNLENFRRCFTAMNLLIVPVVIAIFLCYGTKNSIRSTYGSSHQEDGGYQAVVTLLMFFSGTIGLPFYLFSTWEYYCQDEQLKEECRKLSCDDSDDSQILEALANAGGSFADFLSHESSVERLHDFARLLSNRMLERERTLDAEAVLGSSDRNREDRESMETQMNAQNNMEGSTNLPDFPLGKTDALETIDNGNAEVNFPVLYEFQIRMREQSPDLDIKIEPHDGGISDLLGDGVFEPGIQLTTKPDENLPNGIEMGTSLI